MKTTPRTAAHLTTSADSPFLAVQRVHLMGVPVDGVTEAQAVGMCLDAMAQRRQICIVPINASQTILAHENPTFRSVVEDFELALADGKAVAWGAKWIRRLPIPEQVGLPPFVHRLLSAAELYEVSVFFFGAEEEIVQQTAARARQRWPRLLIAGCRNGYFKPADEAGIVAAVNESRASILLVALPSPMKEMWIARHKRELRAPIIVGVGGLFDVMAGKVRAAPEPIRKLGLEWVFRMLQEPQRLFKRYMTTTPLFVFRLLTGYEPPKVAIEPR